MRQTLLQNAATILLQNATKVFYKISQNFYYKNATFFFLENTTVTTKCKDFITILLQNSYYKTQRYKLRFQNKSLIL